MGLTLDLAGRRVLITGAGQGVGRGVALAFAAAGAEVLVNDIVAERAEAVAAEAGARAAPFDVTDYAACAAAIDAAGGVDILVNNAGNAGAEGIALPEPFAESDPRAWDKYVQVNLFGVLNCTRVALPAMIEKRWGRVITVVSDSARTGDKHLAVYGAAKAAAAAFTRTIASESGRHGITANSIALGTMRTEFTEGLWSNPGSPTAQQIMRGYVVRRPGRPDDVAGLAILLSTDYGSWITGQTIPVNGGSSYAQ